jgi:hypothetical protein
MSQDKQIQIAVSTLEELVACLDAQTAVNTNDTPEQKQLGARCGRIMSSAVTLLRGARGPGSFSGSEIGQYHLDPTQSNFL